MFHRGWESGQAVIVARRTHEGQYRRGINFYAPEGLYHHVYDYVADVTPDGGTDTFRATFTELFESDNEYRPHTGDQARVRFEPKSREVEFDRDALREIATAAKTTAADGFDETAAGAPGSTAAPPPAPADVPADGVAGILQASIAIAKRKGDQAEVDRLEAQLTARSGGAAGAASAPSEDPIDRLAKLADLHDRGVLSDDEFAAEKAKLLADA